MNGFTPIHAIAGGALLATGLACLLVLTGRIAGLSGIVAGVMVPGDRAWRAWFLLAMLGVGGVFALVEPTTFDAGSPVPRWLTACSGVLVGVGTRLANGCTSGHGLCGTSRRSRRSLVATFVFFIVAVLTATFVGGLRS